VATRAPQPRPIARRTKYAAVLPVALIAISYASTGIVRGGPLLVAAAMLFLISYGTALGVFAVLKLGEPKR